jgi:hypothetical protein
MENYPEYNETKKMNPPLLTCGATLWHKFPDKNVACIYHIEDRIDDELIRVYIGQTGCFLERGAAHYWGWAKSELWYKCAPIWEFTAWFELMERWTISIYPVVCSKKERVRKRKD